MPASLLDEAKALLATCEGRGLTLATAESCTGGLIAATLTAIAGSSAVVTGGFVTYSNAMKTKMVDVPEAVLAAHGAVSAEVAQAMAEGALRASGANLALSCTGIAGPGGATPAKPVGLVFIACAGLDAATLVERHMLPGDRAAVREGTVAAAFALARRALSQRMPCTR
ncbi:MAG TPA: nicotinamide-nucleotide amidohydrolase family protein [Acetobacteraceae bacterium]|nr:nicotinamide-nucleotide amidohydrolase family protein [Acetobacteraceae bacterium]